MSLYRCHTIFNCACRLSLPQIRFTRLLFPHEMIIDFPLCFRCLGARTCPKGLNPAEAIAKIKLELAAD